MQKDVIYIDTEDDITAIIGKVKAAEHKIVALVPPKRVGAIQSAVNLKLVHRAAEQAGKRLVVISNNAALMALAGSAGVLVAKNLQSKPELAEIPALEVDEGEDIIDGEIDALSTGAATTSATDATVATAENTASSDSSAKKVSSSLGTAALHAKNKVKIPNFDSFRKKLFIIIAAVILLVGGLIWAFVFAPTADITVLARTSDVALNTQVKLGTDLTTNLKEGTVKLASKSTKKDISVPITATGKKDVGEKATGTVKFTSDSFSALVTGITIPAGTQLTSSGGKVYLTDTTVTLSTSGNTKNSGITAAQSGTSSNGATGSVTGAPSTVNATITGGATAGGTDKTVTVLQQSDVDTAMSSVVSSGDKDTARSSLNKQFGDDYIVLDSSFKADQGAIKPAPAVGEEAADGKATLSGSVTFALSAVPKSEMSTFLKSYFDQSIDGKTDQKVYDNGIKSVSFTNVNAVENAFSANLTTNGKIGPKIDEEALKKFAKGKRLGEIQSYAASTNGIESVVVNFAPFWVSSAPNDVKRISVEFKVND